MQCNKATAERCLVAYWDRCSAVFGPASSDGYGVVRCGVCVCVWRGGVTTKLTSLLKQLDPQDKASIQITEGLLRK